MTKACGFSVGTFKGTISDRIKKCLRCSKFKVIFLFPWWFLGYISSSLEKPVTYCCENKQKVLESQNIFF